MYRRYMTCLALSFFIGIGGCSMRSGVINKRFSNLEGKDEFIALVVGSSLYEPRWRAETNSFLRRYLKDALGSLTGSSISVINSSSPEDTFHSIKMRAEADIISYKPDVVFLMLGVIDSNNRSISDTTHRENVKELFSLLDEYNLFVIVLTSVGFKDAVFISDPRMMRLKEFNEITLWEAGHHNFPVIDVATYMEQLRESSPGEYQSMFLDQVVLNKKGVEYVMGYVMKNLRKSYNQSVIE